MGCLTRKRDAEISELRREFAQITDSLQDQARLMRDRIYNLERQQMDQETELQTLTASVTAHNAADAQYQTDVNTKIAALEAASSAATAPNPAVNTAIADLKAAIAAKPVLVLPA